MILAKTLTPAYNCAHFAADVWESETGRDIRTILSGFLTTPERRRATPQARGDLVRIPSPRSPCLVLFRRVKAVPHVGVFLRGRVFHLTTAGAIRQPLSVASLGYTAVRFYAPR